MLLFRSVSGQQRLDNVNRSHLVQACGTGTTKKFKLNLLFPTVSKIHGTNFRWTFRRLKEPLSIQSSRRIITSINSSLRNPSISLILSSLCRRFVFEHKHQVMTTYAIVQACVSKKLTLFACHTSSQNMEGANLGIKVFFNLSIYIDEPPWLTCLRTFQ